jgi:hypothetical protein
MTDRLHYYLESNDPALYRIKHKKHVFRKINMLLDVTILKRHFNALCLQRQYGEYRSSKLVKFALDQTAVLLRGYSSM